MFSVKEVSNEIRRYTSSNQYYRGIKFSKIEDRDFCAYTSDELSGMFLKGFGGNYESSITIRFSNGVGLEAEVYISNAKASRIGNKLLPTMRSAFEGVPFKISTTRYVPGDTSMSATINLPCANQRNVGTAVETLLHAVALLAVELSKY